MMIARPRGMRRVPSLRSLIQRTTGARMYAIKKTNSGKPHRARNFRDGAFSPNHVSRVRARPPRPRPGSGEPGSGEVGDDDVVDDTGPVSIGRGTPSFPGG